MQNLRSEEKRKVDFLEGGNGGHLVYPIGTFKLFLIYKLPIYFPPNFESIDLSAQEKKHKMATILVLGCPIGFSVSRELLVR